jgi:mRNA-degrading endonuclease RelE of RelBE toxin-antitoxin system
VTYSLHYAVDLGALAEDARLEIERTMQQIAEVVDSIPPANPFWASMNDSLLQIDIGAFRVVYRIDPGRREVRVVDLELRLRRG